ncbi:hypothetical protein EXS74_02155 [Candidatus Woesearchaeota archaeon]|nr:hypothetical protein [Candidatus Woesearchaeota archaeon]
MLQEEKEQKQRETENKFKEYLDQQKIAYWYIQQDIETFSPALRTHNVQRPDFFILLPHFGFILIDVEHREPLEKYKKFCIDNKEATKYNNLQKLFNMQVWYAFSNEKIHYTTWYCIPVAKAIELREKYLVKEKQYISTPIESFTQLSWDEKITKLFQK